MLILEVHLLRMSNRSAALRCKLEQRRSTSGVAGCMFLHLYDAV